MPSHCRKSKLIPYFIFDQNYFASEIIIPFVKCTRHTHTYFGISPLLLKYQSTSIYIYIYKIAEEFTSDISFRDYSLPLYCCSLSSVLFLVLLSIYKLYTIYYVAWDGWLKSVTNLHEVLGNWESSLYKKTANIPIVLRVCVFSRIFVFRIVWSILFIHYYTYQRRKFLSRNLWIIRNTVRRCCRFTILYAKCRGITVPRLFFSIYFSDHHVESNQSIILIFEIREKTILYATIPLIRKTYCCQYASELWIPITIRFYKRII